MLQSHFPGSAVARSDACRTRRRICERGKPSLKTYNNRRGILSTFFKFAFQQDWIADEPDGERSRITGSTIAAVRPRRSPPSRPRN